MRPLFARFASVQYLALYVLLTGCASTQKNRVGEPLRLSNISEEEKLLFSPVLDYLEDGNWYFSDSLWFEAQANFDSALLEMTRLDIGDSSSERVLEIQKTLRDTLLKVMESTTRHATRIQLKPLEQYWDEEMEQVTDSALDKVSHLLENLNPAEYSLPLTLPLDERILQAISVYSGVGRKYFAKWLNRLGRYRDIIHSRLEQRGMPPDLIYLAMIESGFNPKAWSRAKASGIWQFISGTGRRYNLTDDWWIDERRDPVKSTDAALNYLTDLYSEFQNWDLAMAAYNCGEGRVRKRLREDSTRTYWNMELPGETQKYVPKILAAMIIGKHPEIFEFTILPEPPFQFDTVTVTHCISISVISKMIETEEDVLRQLNPELLRWCTPVDGKPYALKIPLGKREQFKNKYASLDKAKLVQWHRHVVRKGETLGHIGSKYGMSVKSLQSANNMRGTLLRVGQALLIPLPGTVNKKAPAEKPGVVEALTQYVVKEGDNLYSLSQQFEIPLSRLLQINALAADALIRPGQKIKVPKGTSPKKDTGNKRSEKESFAIYVVKKGESLLSVANKVGASVDELKTLNRLQSDRLNPGTKLRYPAGRKWKGSEKTFYIVESGDSLWSIARRFGLKLEEIKELNPEMSKPLKPGQQLRIK